MLAELIILLASVLGNTLLGVLILRANSSSETHRLFSKLAAVTVIWLITTYLALQVPSSLGLLLVRLTMVLAAFQILYLYLFVNTFPHNEIPLEKLILQRAYFFAVIVSIVAVTPYMFTALNNGSTTPGPGIVAFLLYALYFVGTTIFTLIRKLRQSTGILHRQLKLLTIGIISSFSLIALMNLGVVALSKNVQFVNLTPLYSLLLIGFVGYAIVTQHLFDIRIFISRAIIYSLLVSFSMAVYGLIVNIITSILRNNSGATGVIFIAIITAAALAFAFEPFKDWIAERTDSWLFKKEYEQQEVTKKLGEQLSSAIGLDEALDAIMHTLTEVLHLNHAAAYVFQTGDLGKQVVKRSRQIGYSNPAKLALSERDFIVEYFTEHPETILVSELEDQYQKMERAVESKATPSRYLNAAELRQHAIRQVIIEKLKALDAAVVIPLQMQATTLQTEE